MFVDSYDETEQLTDAQIDAVCRLLQQAADQLALSAHTECSVTFVSNERIQEINRDYRGKDQPTDVISFALDDEVAGEPPSSNACIESCDATQSRRYFDFG